MIFNRVVQTLTGNFHFRLTVETAVIMSLGTKLFYFMVVWYLIFRCYSSDFGDNTSDQYEFKESPNRPSSRRDSSPDLSVFITCVCHQFLSLAYGFQSRNGGMSRSKSDTSGKLSKELSPVPPPTAKSTSIPPAKPVTNVNLLDDIFADPPQTAQIFQRVPTSTCNNFFYCDWLQNSFACLSLSGQSCNGDFGDFTNFQSASDSGIRLNYVVDNSHANSLNFTLNSALIRTNLPISLSFAQLQYLLAILH